MLSLRTISCALVAAVCWMAVPTQASTTGGTITDLVLKSGGDFDSNKRDYDILLNAVVTADLADALADPDAELTLFAPNDTAFYRLARDLGYKGGYDETLVWTFLVSALTDLGGGDPIPVLTDILLYHVVAGDVRPIDLIFSTFFNVPVQTLLGATFQPFFLQIIDNDPDLRNARVTFPFNIRATNGRIHTVTRVLIPIDLP
ncbi:MAG: fasciclin domain-containing protein [Phycisphaerales bacterium]|nr:fasciclin domain-containing protein [Phycisphaerales bacterium]